MITPGISARLASWPFPCDPTFSRGRAAALLAASGLGLALGLVLADPATDRPMGWFSAEMPPQEQGFAMLTYWMGEAFQGRGLMRDAAAEAVALVFASLPVQALRAAVQGDNTASLSLLTHLKARLLGPGHIWCPSRQRQEACFYYEMARR
ncbi:GNAT family N-acetyltransferase [Humitalea sp. 24SJ18S-53]|uniref:GNAT family N-acetyltransferase n=1 Tax=Humitalea sp. 24SJ18S-53 TaxID=3422307 RepID=UPI003D66B741